MRKCLSALFVAAMTISAIGCGGDDKVVTPTGTMKPEGKPQGDMPKPPAIPPAPKG